MTENYMTKITDHADRVKAVLAWVENEMNRARDIHPPMNSPHEGYAVMLEEMDELWEEVKHDRGGTVSAATEAVQIAAMALLYVVEVTK